MRFRLDASSLVTAEVNRGVVTCAQLTEEPFRVIIQDQSDIFTPFETDRQ